MFPPTMFGTVIPKKKKKKKKKKKRLPCINVQCNKDFLGNESGENELTAIPD